MGELIDINADKEARTIEMSMFIPYSKSVGQYVIEGKVAVLQLEAYDPSPYVTEFTNTTVTGKAQLNIRNNRIVIDEDPDITIDVGGLNIKMEKLFNLPRLSTSSSTRTLTSSSRTSSLPLPSPSLASSRVSTTVPSGTLMLVYSNSSLLSSILSVSNYLYLI